MASLPNAEVLLAIDVGTTNTRASLFDVIDGRYRLVATSDSQSTANAPLYDISEGVRLALDRVQAITGRRLMDEADALITPTTGFGGGVDLFVASVSAGPRVKTILAGLMPGVSLASARRLAESSYLDVVGEISIVDNQKIESLVDMIVSSRPDLIIATGGTDNGASQPLFQLLEILKLSIGLLPEGMRPQVVFAGNRSLGALVTDQLSDRTQVTLMPNVRPSLEIEDLSPARLQLAETIFNIRSSHIAGYQELKQWTGGSLLPSAEAFGRLVRYLSKVYDPDKGVLGVDIGASYTTIAGAFGGHLNLSVNSDLGMGSAILGLEESGSAKDVLRWLPIEANESQIKDYIYTKSIHPRSIPTTSDDLQLEYAIARQVLRQALRKARNSWPEGKDNRNLLTLPPVEPIVAAGAVLARAPHPYETALILLDGLQPVGVTTLVLDPYSLTSALGSAAGPLPIATVQLLEAGVLVSMGTVVAPVGRGRLGMPVLSYRLDREDGTSPIVGEIEFGQISVLPLPAGRYARLTITPERGFDIGFGTFGRSATLRVSGGVVGVIIDARGRPIPLPEDRGRQMELAQKWLWEIGKVEQ
jgi:hypothetical protein